MREREPHQVMRETLHGDNSLSLLRSSRVCARDGSRGSDTVSARHSDESSPVGMN